MTKIKVRIAVAVDTAGKWSAVGWASDMSRTSYDKEAMGLAVDGVDSGEVRYWLEAELDLPAGATTVQAEVTKA